MPTRKSVLCISATLSHPPGTNPGKSGWNSIGKRNGKPVVYTTAKTKAWIEAAKLCLMAAGAKWLPEGREYETWITVDLFTAGNIDVDKRIPILLDVIQAVTGVNDKCVVALHAYKYRVRHVVERCVKISFEIREVVND